MTRSVFIRLCAIFLAVHSTDQLTCGPGEVETSCPSDTSFDYCPLKEPQEESSCESDCGIPRCKCGFNKRRAPNGTCINTRDCPPFKCSRPNEEYVACPPYCPTDDCKQATPDGTCPMVGLLVMVECSPACRCIKGYWRKNGKCVPYRECPPQPALPNVVFG